MNKKGFTLVELLAVIILLGVMALIATITVSNEIKESKQEMYEIQIRSIKDAAKVWGDANIFSLPENNNDFIVVTLGQLKSSGFIKDVINPMTKEPFPDNLQIKITMLENNYVYEVDETQQPMYEIAVKNIKNAAKAWGEANTSSLPVNNNEFVIVTLIQLKTANLIDDVENPITKEPFPDDLQIKIIKTESNYLYEIVE